MSPKWKFWLWEHSHEKIFCFALRTKFSVIAESESAKIKPLKALPAIDVTSYVAGSSPASQ